MKSEIFWLVVAVAVAVAVLFIVINKNIPFSLAYPVYKSLDLAK
jgi:multidrug transporter EmrE-like cation transporter